jgi:phosphoribosyl-ATP pyrophosphohydrolase
LTARAAPGSERAMTDDPLDRLSATIAARRAAPADQSYTAQLFVRGRGRIAQKLGEEAVELVIAATSEPAKIVPEAADLLYHLLVLLADADVSLDEVRAELARREGTGGLTEKAGRLG